MFLVAQQLPCTPQHHARIIIIMPPTTTQYFLPCMMRALPREENKRARRRFGSFDDERRRIPRAHNTVLQQHRDASKQTLYDSTLGLPRTTPLSSFACPPPLYFLGLRARARCLTTAQCTAAARSLSLLSFTLHHAHTHTQLCAAHRAMAYSII